METKMREKITFAEFNNFAYYDEKNLSNDLSAKYVLKRVVSVFRHGHRTPFSGKTVGLRKKVFDDKFFSNLNKECFNGKDLYMYKEVSIVPNEGLNLEFDCSINANAMLTTKGAEQMFQVGKDLYSRYKSFFATEFEKNPSRALRAVSSPTERTIESLKSVMNGFLEFASSKPNIQINILDDVKKNYMFLPVSVYPELKESQRAAHNHKRKAQFVPGYTEWAAEMEKKCGIDPEDLNLHHVRDYLCSFWTFDMMKLLSGTGVTRTDLEKSELFCSYTVAMETLNIENGLKLASAALFQELLLLLKSEDESTICLLSGHDTTINSIRLALRALDFTWPDFAYNVEFELYEEKLTKQLSVLILFNLKPIIVKVISDQPLIPLEVFESWIQTEFL